MTVLAIGSIIKVNNYKLFVIGYTTAENGTYEKSGYLVVPYPTGFSSFEKMFFIPFDAEYSVVAEGYKTNDTENLINVIAKSMINAEKIPYDDLVKLQDIYKNALRKKGDA